MCRCSADWMFRSTSANINIPSLVEVMVPRTHFWTFKLPRDSSHDIYSVGSTHSDTDATQATTIGCVGVGTNQQYSRIGIVLQNDLCTERDIQSGTYFRSLKDCWGAEWCKEPICSIITSVHCTWWMIPEPGFQKPTPYLAAAVARKLYTSSFTSCV